MANVGIDKVETSLFLLSEVVKYERTESGREKGEPPRNSLASPYCLDLYQTSPSRW